MGEGPMRFMIVQPLGILVKPISSNSAMGFTASSTGKARDFVSTIDEINIKENQNYATLRTNNKNVSVEVLDNLGSERVLVHSRREVEVGKDGARVQGGFAVVAN